MVLFRLHDLCFDYAGQVALGGVSAAVGVGERVALLGANGSGKSTLLRLLDGLAAPTGGRIEYRGRDLVDLLTDEAQEHEFRRRVAYLFQDSDVQLFNPTVLDEVAFGPIQLGWDAARVRSAVAAALGELAIEGLSDRAPFRLSGGEKKRVALASVLVLDPEVLLLDEPTAGLDPRGRRQLIALLRQLRGERTLVIATHDLSLAQELTERAIVLDGGRVAADGATGEIVRDRELLEAVGVG